MVQADCECSDEVLAFLDEFTARYARHDIAGVAEMVTEDGVYSDHRALSPVGEVSGIDELVAFLKLTFEMLPDFQVDVVVLAHEGDTYLARDTYAGHAGQLVGGGEALMQWWVVDTLRDGKLAREDIYDTEDQARAEYERRRS